MKTLSCNKGFLAAVVAFFAAIFMLVAPTVGCGSDDKIDLGDTVIVNVPPDAGTSSSSSSSSSTSSSHSGGAGGGTAGGGGFAGFGGDGGDAGSGGDAGFAQSSSSSSSSSSGMPPPVYLAKCSGVIPSWAWKYNVVDDGVWVDVDIHMDNLQGVTCDNKGTFPHVPPDPNDPVTDELSVLCNGSIYQFSIARATKIMYIFEGIQAWTPPC